MTPKDWATLVTARIGAVIPCGSTLPESRWEIGSDHDEAQGQSN